MFFINCYSLFSNEITLYPNKIIPESFLIESDKIYGVKKIYDQNIKTSFSFGLKSSVSQKIVFYFYDNVELTAFSIANGFQGKDKFYKYNSRAKNVILTTEDKNGNMNTFNYNILDSIEKQRNSISLLKNEKINKVIMTFNLPGYKGEKYDDLCISEITFYGNNTDNLKDNNNPKSLDKYFNSLNYNFKNNYSNFFKKNIEYYYREGGLIQIKNKELCLKYINLYIGSSKNNGIKGKFKIDNNVLIFNPNQILVSKGAGEDYEIIWQNLKNRKEIIFLIEQEKCFIKLIPKGKYDILQPLMNYVNEWKQAANNAPKGDYIPIVIQ